jgi:hypothetical protein
MPYISLEDAENWDQLILFAGYRENSIWIKERSFSVLSTFYHFRDSPIPMPTLKELANVAIGDPFTDDSDKFKLVVFGAHIAKDIEELTGNNLWQNADEAVSLAQHFGKIFVACVSYFYEMDASFNMQIMSQAKDLEISPASFGESRLQFSDALSEEINKLRMSGLPMPMGVGVVKTMKEILGDYPQRLYQEPDYSWPDFLYETVIKVIDSPRPNLSAQALPPPEPQRS